MHIERGVLWFGVWREFLRAQIQGNVQEVATFLFASMVFCIFLSLSSPLPLESVGGLLARHPCKFRFQFRVFHSVGRASNNRLVRGSRINGDRFPIQVAKAKASRGVRGMLP